MQSRTMLCTASGKTRARHRGFNGVADRLDVLPWTRSKIRRAIELLAAPEQQRLEMEQQQEWEHASTIEPTKGPRVYGNKET